MLPKSHKVIVELYGLPGGGKSTLARTLVSEYGFQSIPPNLKRYHYFLLSLRYPLTVLSWFLLIFKNFCKAPSLMICTYNISLLFSSLQKLHDAARHPSPMVVIDEGLAQRFLSFSDTVQKPSEISRLLKRSPLGTVLILVNDREVTSDRFSTSHLRASRGEASLTRWRQNLKTNLETLTAVIQHSSLVHFETKEVSVDAILAKINS